MLFNAMKGDTGGRDAAEATDRLGQVMIIVMMMMIMMIDGWQGDADLVGDGGGLNSVDQPMTPCPSAVEYVTPVFAKNYQVQSQSTDIFDICKVRSTQLLCCRACGGTWSRSRTRATSPRPWRWSSVSAPSASSCR